jgi:chemotaxis-related protein WspB
MLFLLMKLGGDRYALDARQVAQVLPLLQIKKIPHAPLGIAGAVDYRGVPVPVVDLSELMLRRPAQRQLSTRIVMVHYPGRDGARHLLGLIAENATEVIRREPSEFVSAGVESPEGSYLGPVVTDAGGMIQWIRAQDLLPEAVRDALFQQVAES